MNTENNSIIHITTTEDGQQTVNARELHRFLESKQDFSNWIKNRITGYKFVEDRDFTRFSINLSKTSGGRPSTEYLLTVDMAMSLSMVENNEKGEQARAYFIDCKKRVDLAQKILEEAENIPPARKMPTIMDLHRDQLAYLIAQGVPAGTACRSADKLMQICKKLPGIISPKHEVPDERAITIQDLRNNMRPGILYRVNQLAKILPPDHPMHTTDDLTPAIRSSFGKYLAWAVDEGLLEKNSPSARFPLYNLPAIVTFPAAQTAQS